jgi:glycosyltransferase involved in cell wall biosynthesis
MRIAIVAQHGSPLTPTRDPQADAQAAGMTALARALAADGHRVTVYARRDSRELPDSVILCPGVTVEHLDAGPPVPLADDKLVAQVRDFGDQLARRWAQNLPDLAHAWHWTSGLAALAAARDQQVPVVQSFGSLAAAERRHGLPERGPAGRLRLETCIARGTDAVLAGTSAEAAELVRMGVRRSSIAIVPAGVDTSLFTPDGPAAERTERPRLLAVAPLQPGQGLNRLVRMLPGVPEVELVIVGGPPRAQLRTDPVYRDLMKLARDVKVQRRLVFTGRVGQEDLPDLLRSADLLVSAAPYEPLGTLTIAAMACGTPAAVSAVGGNRDAVLDETTGLLVAPGRLDLLTRRVRRLLATPPRLEAFGIAAADRARARYSMDRIGRETAAAYTRCLSPAGAHALVPAQAGPAPSEDLDLAPVSDLAAALA